MSSRLPIPEKALADCGAILGRRGAGKSGTGRVLLEHELDLGHRCCVLDPKGDWYGIRAKKDGKPSRFAVPVFGGAHADVPIDDSMGAQLGEIVATSSTSCVVDLSSFSVAGMRRFTTAFAEALFFHNRQPLTLFVDEADQLAPQRVAADQAKLLHNMEALIRQGRQRGIFMWMLTQRPAVINKNLLSQAETLVAMKMTGPQDRKAIRDWMDAHDPVQAQRVENDLAKLEVGQAWAWVPGADFLQRVQFPLFETYDSGRTPQHGERVGAVELQPLDVAELAAALAPDKEEEEDASDRLRRRVAGLEERNEQLERDKAEARRYGDQLLATLTAVQDVVGAHIGSMAIVPLPTGVDAADFVMLVDADDIVRPFPREPGPGRRVAAARRRIADAPPIATPPATPDAEVLAPRVAALAGARLQQAIAGDVPAVRRIVTAVAIAGELDRADVPALAGVSATSSHITVGIRKLVERGFLHQDGERLTIAAEYLA
jgi:hypothetical protein